MLQFRWAFIVHIDDFLPPDFPSSFGPLNLLALALTLYRSLGFTQEEVVYGRMPGNEAFSVTVHCLTTPEEA